MTAGYGGNAWRGTVSAYAFFVGALQFIRSAVFYVNVIINVKSVKKDVNFNVFA